MGRPRLGRDTGSVGTRPGAGRAAPGRSCGLRQAHELSHLGKLTQVVGVRGALLLVEQLLEPLLLQYAKEREEGERFGDFVIRAGVIKPTLGGNTFHSDITLV